MKEIKLDIVGRGPKVNGRHIRRLVEFSDGTTGQVLARDVPPNTPKKSRKVTMYGDIPARKWWTARNHDTSYYDIWE